MARKRLIQPVRPRRSDERSYFQSINALVLDLQAKTNQKVSDASQQLSSWLIAVNNIFASDEVLNKKDVNDIAQDNFKKLKDYHTQQFFMKANSAFGIDVTPLLHDLFINQALNDRIKQNVQLIKSIPEQLHPQLLTDIIQVYQKQGFDRAGLLQAINGRFSVASSRAKLIARDQTSKAIGQFTQIRQQQLGIDKYQWIGTDDGRERPTHIANNNQIFSWNSPPPDTGNPGDDINCRCTAAGVVEF